MAMSAEEVRKAEFMRRAREEAITSPSGSPSKKFKTGMVYLTNVEMNNHMLYNGKKTYDATDCYMYILKFKRAPQAVSRL